MKKLPILLFCFTCFMLTTSYAQFPPTFYGLNAGDEGDLSSYFGRNAGKNTTGNKNSFFGHNCGFANIDGVSNVFMGAYAGRFNISGSYNNFIGAYAGFRNVDGKFNSYLGYYCGVDNVSGTRNVFLGHSAGKTNLGHRNVFIGFQAGYNETGSDKLYISNSNTATPLIYGDFSTKQVGINTNTIPDGYYLAVDGKIMAEEVRVQLSENWPDYVFEPDYDLMSITELKQYIAQHKHLPEVPSAAIVEQEGGVDVGEMNALLLKKVEELSLYIIQLQEEVEALKKK